MFVDRNRGFIANRYGGQAGAARERPVPDARHARGYCDRGQAGASLVFVNRVISITCTLNGRKVIT